MIPFVPVKPVRGGRPLDALYARLDASRDWVCQAKLDGQRAVWDGARLWARTGARITACRSVTEALQGVSVTLDAEFVRLNQRDGVLWVFDLPDHGGQLGDRLDALADLMADIGAPGVVEPIPVGVAWSDVSSAGWEGVVFKRLASSYPRATRQGVTTPWWVKYRAAWQR